MEASMDKVIKDIQHRLHLLELSAHEVQLNHSRQKKALVDQRIIYDDRMKQLRNELQEIKELCDIISKTMQSIGKQLPELAAKGKVNTLATQAQERNYAELLPREELRHAYLLHKLHSKEPMPSLQEGEHLANMKAHIKQNMQRAAEIARLLEEAKQAAKKKRKDPIFG